MSASIREKIKEREGFVLYYPVIRVGIFPGLITDFFLPILSLSYVSNKRSVGICLCVFVCSSNRRQYKSND